MLPHDFDPDEELELYELFSTLRRSVFVMIQGLADRILSRVEREEQEQERMEAPDAASLLENSLLSAAGALVSLIRPANQARPDERAQPEDDSTPDGPGDPSDTSRGGSDE